MVPTIIKSKKIKKPIPLTPIKSNKSIELFYYKELKRIANTLMEEVSKEIIPLLKTNTVKVKDGINEITFALNNLSNKYKEFSIAPVLANEVVNKINANSKQRFVNSVNSAVGVDLMNVLNEESLTDLVALQKNKNKVLIKSIPLKFIEEVEIVVQNGMANGLRYEAIAKQLNGIKDISSTYGKLKNRVKLIARNEVSTINASINKARYENAGITKAIWQTSEDNRVRDGHKALNGKEYVIGVGLKDPQTGQLIEPSQAINCRCVAIPIME